MIGVPQNLYSASNAARLALRCLDLTSLNDADTSADIEALCARAQTPYGRVAAVCVWPRFVGLARSLLPSDIRVAAVANFPKGRLDAAAAVAEVHAILAAGGDEMDVVLPYGAFLQGQNPACQEFLQAVRAACGTQVLKVIIESGVLHTPSRIVRATKLALACGADFVKTSTGKTAISATPAAAELMLQEIASCKRVAGFKASGGIRTVADAGAYLDLVTHYLGAKALVPARFRLGASSLLDDILRVLSAQAPVAPDATQARK